MRGKRTIIENLNKLNYLFDNDKDNQVFYAKLAILELCGWIEVTIDEVVNNLGDKNLKTNECQKILKSEIKKVSSFTYENHFRKLIVQVIGLAGVEKTEIIIGDEDIDLLDSKLKTLKLTRDAQAHTFIDGVTPKLDAPSLTIKNYESVEKMISKIEKALENI